MAKYKAKTCNCMAANSQEPDCYDVCSNPKCGDPKLLSLLVPVIYDEIGINLCRSIPLGETVATDYPTAVCATAEVIDIAIPAGTPTSVAIVPITGRPNCYTVTLTNLTVTFAVKLYDPNNRLLAVVEASGVYLPTNSTIPDYTYFDEDTNPEMAEFEIFAPYGISYIEGTTTPTVQFVGFSSANNTYHQGLNLLAMPKVLNYNPVDATVTMGISLYVKSIYYSQYLFSHHGKVSVPKAELTAPTTTVCMDFVCGSLLDRSIKPLELSYPDYEGEDKNDCTQGQCQFCTDNRQDMNYSYDGQ